MIVSPPVLDRWLRDAKAGETIVYARATYLIPNTVTRRLFALYEAGHVSLTRQRRQHGNGDENFHYIARRTGKPFPDLKSARGGAKGKGKPHDLRFGSQSAVMREIEGDVRSMIAEGVTPCASRMARMLGLYSPKPVSMVLQRMAA